MIYKRGNVYWYHFCYDKKHYQKSTKQGNPKVARAIEAAYRTALAKGDVGITERKKIPGLKAAMDSFLKWSKTEHREHPNTYLRYKYSSLTLLRYFKDAQLDTITPAEVEKFKVARLAEHKTVRGKDGQRNPTKERISVATVNRELACLRAMFNHALKDGLPLMNPISKVGAKTFHEANEQTRVLTYGEQEAYLAKATATLRDVAGLILETGMRPEEVYRSRPENVHLGEDYLFNPYGKTKAARRRISPHAHGEGHPDAAHEGM